MPNDLKKARELLKKHNIDENLADYYYKYLINNNLFHSNTFFEGIKKLCEEIPIQYIIGNVNFYGNIIKVDKRVLIPRFETEELVSYTKDFINAYFKNNIKILDIGTGSGNIAITLKKFFPHSFMIASDISLEAIELAKENAKNNQVEVEFIHSNLFAKIKGKYNIIISNPPYLREDEEIMPLVKDNEPHLALYAKNNGIYFYQEILKQASSFLEDEYLIAFEIGLDQSDAIKELAYKYLNDANVIIKKDMNNRERFIFITNVNKK